MFCRKKNICIQFDSETTLDDSWNSKIFNHFLIVLFLLRDEWSMNYRAKCQPQKISVPKAEKDICIKRWSIFAPKSCAFFMCINQRDWKDSFQRKCTKWNVMKYLREFLPFYFIKCFLMIFIRSTKEVYIWDCLLPSQ